MHPDPLLADIKKIIVIAPTSVLRQTINTQPRCRFVEDLEVVVEEDMEEEEDRISYREVVSRAIKMFRRKIGSDNSLQVEVVFNNRALGRPRRC